MDFPKLIVFDLDYTLYFLYGRILTSRWPLWIDTHITPPLKPSPKLNIVLDRYTPSIRWLTFRHNDKISFYQDVPSILHNLKETKIPVAAASRTHTPHLARKALNLLKVPPTGKPADTFFDHLVIYPGIPSWDEFNSRE